MYQRLTATSSEPPPRRWRWRLRRARRQRLPAAARARRWVSAAAPTRPWALLAVHPPGTANALRPAHARLLKCSARATRRAFGARAAAAQTSAVTAGGKTLARATVSFCLAGLSSVCACFHVCVAPLRVRWRVPHSVSIAVAAAASTAPSVIVTTRLSGSVAAAAMSCVRALSLVVPGGKA